MNNEINNSNRLFRATSGQVDLTQCETCRAELPALVDAEMADEAVWQRFQHILEHLDTCVDCDETYATLVDLTMAEERGLLPQGEAAPVAALWFLPAPSLPNYVRQLVKRLVQTFNPALLMDVQDLLEPFLERVKALGNKPLPIPSPVLGEGRAALQVLAATYATTQAIITRFSPQEIEAQQAQQTLIATLHDQAEQEALRQGFEPIKAQIFADQYADRVSHDTQALKVLSVKEQAR